MIRVLVINTVTFHINGMSNVIMGLYENTKSDALHFDFLVCNHIDPEYEKTIRERGSGIFILRERNKKPVSYVKNLAQIIKKGSYDIIHIHGNSATMSIEIFAARCAGSKAKIIVHAHNTECEHHRLNKLFYRYFIANSNYRIACSRAAGEWLYQQNKFHVLNNGIDEKRFAFDPQLRQTYRKELGIEDRFVVLHIGRFNRQKNHAYLLRVFKALLEKKPDAVLRLIGDGELLDDAKQQAQALGIAQSVCFAGTTDKPEREYCAADVFVLPSLFESFGLVNVEAQCAGLPCVISDQVPTDIAITENISFLPIDADPQVWADQILSYQNAERTDQQARVVQSGYSLADVARKYQRMLLKIGSRNARNTK